MSTTIAVNDPTIQGSMSPFNWVTNGSTYIQSINPGAYITAGFNGTSLTITVDVSFIDGHGYSTQVYPVIMYSVDGGAYTQVWIAPAQTSIVVASGLTDAAHILTFVFTGTSPKGQVNWWLPENQLRITGFVVDTGKTMILGSTTFAAPYLAYGDSITAGVGTTNDPIDILAENPIVGYQSLLATWMNRPYGNVAFAGQAWNGGGGGIPGLVSSYNLIYTAVSRVFSPTPAVVSINMGRNGSPTDAAQVSTFLGTIRGVCNASTVIFLIIPFDQSAVTILTGGYNSYHTANPSDKTYLIDLGSAGAAILAANTYDGVHPNTAGYALLAAALEPLMAPYLVGPALKRLGAHLKLVGYGS